MMKVMTAVLVACCVMTLATCKLKPEPRRTEGINASVVPSSNGGGPEDGLPAWAFRVILPGEKAPDVTRSDLESPQALIDFVLGQRVQARENGLWILVNDAGKVSEELKKALREVRRLTTEKEIPLYLCRSSEFPYGWDRVN